ncbi:NTF2-like N-terminal transpeptidase domain-containing protein [Arthrobacter sp. ZGTC212]|uniref:NTF2-like N-terminal transpeptidase domain-containing protein n=1 Tax=Arthrobacter sp. ZGTC212 TaxID=2058899 RepID=UPI000CE3EF1C|nr:NTF2-like N-terminal transpeptidase domain-containing protein [Arthrobacter sp. ZGTC212]
MGKNRLTAAILVFSFLGLPLAGCSDEERPGPEEAVASLADGISRVDVTGNEFAGSTVEAVNGMLEYVVSGMKIKPSVTVSKIDEVSANEAVATLNYVWDVNASTEDYTYQTTVTLERGSDTGWQTRFRSTTVHPDLLPWQRLVRKASPPTRADILGAGGSVLVRHWPVWQVVLDKSVLGENEYAASVYYLSLFLDLDADALTAKVQAAGPDDFVEVTTVRQDKVSPSFDSEIATIPGADALPERRVLGPSPGFAADLLGTVGPATDEMAADGLLAPGDLTGLSGLQREYDSQLRGSDAVTVRVLNADNTLSPPLFEAPAEPGVALETTLDLGIQSQADALLADTPGGSLVAIQPSTGNVLAVANSSGGKGTQTALLGEYSLGRSFLPVTELARLRAGAPGGTEEPDIPADADLAAASQSLGLGTAEGLGTPAFYGGAEQTVAADVPGTVLASPFAVAAVAASVGRGERVSPVLVLNPGARQDSGDGEAEPPSSAGAPALFADEAEQLQSILRANVAGVRASEELEVLGYVSGKPVMAAAGTAGTGGEKPDHAWVAAIQGDLAVAVFLPGSSADAVAVTAAFLEALAG